MRHLPHLLSFLKYFLNSNEFFATNQMLIKPSETHAARPTSQGLAYMHVHSFIAEKKYTDQNRAETERETQVV